MTVCKLCKTSLERNELTRPCWKCGNVSVLTELAESDVLAAPIAWAKVNDAMELALKQLRECGIKYIP